MTQKAFLYFCVLYLCAGMLHRLTQSLSSVCMKASEGGRAATANPESSGSEVKKKSAKIREKSELKKTKGNLQKYLIFSFQGR